MKAGETAQDFTLVDQDGIKFNLYENLSSPIVLIFYPKDDSLICTKQLCQYNSNIQEFSKLGVKLIGISVDGQSSHKNFANKYALKIRLLCDKNGLVSKMYEALSFRKNSKRKIYIIDKDRTIKYVDEKLSWFYLNYSELIKILKAVI